MIILLDTSTPICKLDIVDGDKTIGQSWDSGRKLAVGLLDFLNKQLSDNNYSWGDIEGIGVYKGPGSFTGLRIGITVMNTIADAKSVSIVGSTGENWRDDALAKIRSGKDEKLVLPEYGREANITVSTK